MNKSIYKIAQLITEDPDIVMEADYKEPKAWAGYYNTKDEAINLKQEMMQFLQEQYQDIEDTQSLAFMYDCEAAIYWLAKDYGRPAGLQDLGSLLYMIYKSSKYKPGRATIEVEGETDEVYKMYTELANRFLERKKPLI
jgi:hypothetical protein